MRKYQDKATTDSTWFEIVTNDTSRNHPSVMVSNAGWLEMQYTGYTTYTLLDAKTVREDQDLAAAFWYAFSCQR